MTMMRGRLLAVTAALGLAVAGLAACSGTADNGDNTPGQTQELSGDVKADGSSTVGPLTKAAASFYAEEQPKVNVTVGITGTGGGFKKFCVGETDISNASRPIKDSEKAECDKNGVKFQQLSIANDALTVVVNKEATWVDCLTVEQLKKAWEPDSKVNNWNQIDASFPNEPLKLYGPGTDSGTFDYFTAEINGKEKASRTDFEPSEDDNILVQGVAASKGAMGYFGFTYFEENQDKLKALKIDGGSGCVAPSVAATQDGTYKPLGRPLFIYISDKGLAKPQVKAFIDFYIAKIDDVVKEARYVPLTAAQKQQLADDYAKLKG